MKLFIIVVSTVVVIATAATIYVGGRSFEGIVVEKPYEAGLAWDAVRQNKLKLGWQVSIRQKDYHIGNNELLLNVQDRDGAPIRNAEVKVTISRPSTRDHDKNYHAAPDPNGQYHASVDLPLPGAWEAKIVVKVNNEQGAFSEMVHASKGGQ